MHISMEKVKSNFLNRLPLEIVGFAPAIILTDILCNVSIFLLLDQLPWKIISYFMVEWKQVK